MRSAEKLKVVRKLSEAGLNDCEISRRTGVPRTTVQGWRSGKAPRKPVDGACQACGHRHHLDEFSWEYAYLLGMYLGDGHIAAYPRGVYALRIYCDRAYPGIIEECRVAMSATVPNNRVAVYRDPRERMTTVSAYSKRWACLFPQHGPGRKHERVIAIDLWQLAIVERNPRSFLRGLVHSDGCRSINRVRTRGKRYAYPRYTFTNASADIRGLFCHACDQVGVEWRRMNARNISVAKRASVETLDSFIGPKR